MSLYGLLQVGSLLIVVVLISWPLGLYIWKVMEESRARSGSVVASVERVFYRLCGVDAQTEVGWPEYATGLLVFNVAGAVMLYGLQRLQGALPLNPAGLAEVAPLTAFNTAISFATNTSWQSYSGETTLSYAAQMIGIASQSFLSAATGIAALMALLRGFARVEARTVGNVWVDLTRGSICVLLPLAALFAVLPISQGSIQNFDANRVAAMLEPGVYAATAHGPDGTPLGDAQGRPAPTEAMTIRQVLPMGPVASQTDNGRRDVVWTLRADRGCTSRRRFAGQQEAPRSRARDSAHTWALVCRSSDRHRTGVRRPDVSARHRAWAYR
jgi:K+-transporting ATPase ATPase A chain